LAWRRPVITFKSTWWHKTSSRARPTFPSNSRRLPSSSNCWPRCPLADWQLAERMRSSRCSWLQTKVIFSWASQFHFPADGRSSDHRLVLSRGSLWPFREAQQAHLSVSFGENRCSKSKSQRRFTTVSSDSYQHP